MDNWISVDEGNIERGKRYLCCHCIDGWYKVLSLNSFGWVSDRIEYECPTHYQELDELPPKQ